ncbi:MAG: phosphocholine cytidylyltransferase family protein [Verrucomicrobia bacterium]|nr:phosphocholine cytidylyltransferase family protein [Verrucomicrobiota bacterium]
MDAIIYAAGRARRLDRFSEGKTKILLEFGGRSLLERHVDLLARLRVSKIHVVTGYLHEQVQAVLPLLASRYGVVVEEIYNPDFLEGSVLSMEVSLPTIQRAQEPILLMDGDVLYHSSMLRQLMDAESPTALLVDTAFSKADDDPVLVPMNRGRPFEFVKMWRGESERLGESVGFFKLDPRDIPKLVEETRIRCVPERRSESYDEVLRALVRDGRFGAVDVTGIPWTEIDFPSDITRAEREILPKLD